MSRKVTIKELAAALHLSVPTLRKYGECGLLDVDAVSGRTNLFDEATATRRIDEIHDLKKKGYSLALIREKLVNGKHAHPDLDLGLEGPSFSRGRHVLVVMRDINEFQRFARSFTTNGLRAGQAVVAVIHPDRRQQFRALLERDGYNAAELERSRQLSFTWYDDLEHLDPAAQVASWTKLLSDVIAAGWQEVRGIGDPLGDFQRALPAALHDCERLVDRLVEQVPGIVVCTWLAPHGSAEFLMDLQRHHRELKFGDQVYQRT